MSRKHRRYSSAVAEQDCSYRRGMRHTWVKQYQHRANQHGAPRVNASRRPTRRHSARTRQDEKSCKHLHCRPGLQQNIPSPRPPVDVVRRLPQIELARNPLDKILLLARLGEISVTLVVETAEDDFQAVDGVVLDVVPLGLVWHSGEVKREEDREPRPIERCTGLSERLTSKSAHGSALAMPLPAPRVVGGWGWPVPRKESWGSLDKKEHAAGGVVESVRLVAAQRNGRGKMPRGGSSPITCWARPRLTANYNVDHWRRLRQTHSRGEGEEG